MGAEVRRSPELVTTTAECDREIASLAALIHGDDEVDADSCRLEIDRWLDRRNAITRGVLKRAPAKR